MNIQDFTKQWERAVEVLENNETLQVRSALVAGVEYTKNGCHTPGDGNRYCQYYQNGIAMGDYKCTKTWTASPC